MKLNAGTRVYKLKIQFCVSGMSEAQNLMAKIPEEGNDQKVQGGNFQY